MTGSQAVPLWIRRLTEPAFILAAVSGLVLGARSLGHPLASPGRDYGAFAIGLAVLYLFVRIFNYLLFDVLFRLRRESEAPALLREIAALALFLIGLAILLKGVLSVQLTAVLATSAVITAVLGLALQETLGNLFSGLALHLEKSLQAGDMIRVGDQIGIVEELSWRAVKVRTLLDTRILVPNGVAAREKLEIFPRGARPVGHSFRIFLEYSVSPRRAIDLLQRTVADVPGVAAHPEPAVYLSQFGEYALAFEIRYWMEDYALLFFIDSRVHERIWYALAREGLSVPMPISVRYQYMRAWEDAHASTPDAEALRALEILAPLSDAERAKLAARCRRNLFAAGEIVFREGAAAHSLYVVESGELAVFVGNAAGLEVEVGSLSPGDTFGEMALLTGEPRSATVRAKTESALFRIDKDAFGEVLQANPQLLSKISRLMEGRREKNQDAIDLHRNTSRIAPATAASLLSRIARFFGIEVSG